MEETRKLEMLNEIKQIERELYIKRSELASAEAMADEVSIGKAIDTDEWQRTFTELIAQVGALSAGGNSVEDVLMERQR